MGAAINSMDLHTHRHPRRLASMLRRQLTHLHRPCLIPGFSRMHDPTLLHLVSI